MNETHHQHADRNCGPESDTDEPRHRNGRGAGDEQPKGSKSRSNKSDNERLARTGSCGVSRKGGGGSGGNSGTHWMPREDFAAASVTSAAEPCCARCKART